MSYTALYRKFRPDNYDDVKGQEHITRTLANQLKKNRIGHAYLFCGTRGTGKTSVAKIFARAVNCENPINGNPCNECPTCRSIIEGTSMNVIEMDAASNNGVDSIRDIVEEVTYSPTSGKYKVYIIDEVHMLSISAFNALLKTLEEPPSYVIFILATTEAHKIPITILSRCQRYDFKHISVDVIKNRLSELATKENMDVEDKALTFISKMADGSLRDALSLLDECEAFCIDEKLTYDKTLEILGAVDTTIFSNILRCILNQDTIGVMKHIEEMVNYGRDLLQFVIDFTWYLRNLLLIKTEDDADEIIDISEENLLRLKEEGEIIETPVIMRYIRVLSELTNQIKYSSQKRVLIEIALIKLMKPEMEKDVESLTNRLANIEKKLENGILIDGASKKNVLNKKEEAREEKVIPKEELVKAVPEDIKKVIENWNDILKNFDPLSKSYMKNSKLLMENETLLVVPENNTAYSFLKQKESNIKYTIEKNIEKEIGFKISEANFKEEADSIDLKDIFGKINMSVEDNFDDAEEM